MERTLLLNLDPLIEQLKSSIEQSVTQYINSQFDDIITQIATRFNLDKNEVINSIDTKCILEPSCVKNKKVLNIDDNNCTGLTKAGLPCRYKLVPGEKTCKKHKILSDKKKQPLTVNDLPTDEQGWFQEKPPCRSSFFPTYSGSSIAMKSEIVNDDTYVTDE